jgi:hypothetical protein
MPKRLCAQGGTRPVLSQLANPGTTVQQYIRGASMGRGTAERRGEEKEERSPQGQSNAAL